MGVDPMALLDPASDLAGLSEGGLSSGWYRPGITSVPYLPGFCKGRSVECEVP